MECAIFSLGGSCAKTPKKAQPSPLLLLGAKLTLMAPTQNCLRVSSCGSRWIPDSLMAVISNSGKGIVKEYCFPARFTQEALVSLYWSFHSSIKSRKCDLFEPSKRLSPSVSTPSEAADKKLLQSPTSVGAPRGPALRHETACGQA